MTPAAEHDHIPIARSYEVKEFVASYGISDREADVFLLLANGVTTTNDISERLGLSPNTISNHLNSLLNKTQTKNKAELLSKFLRIHARKLEESRLLVRKPRVLLIDEDVNACIAVQQNLSLRGFQVFTSQGHKMLPRDITGMRLDLILVSEDVDGRRGTELIRRLRMENDACPPCVLISEKGEERALLTAEGIEVVTRPLHFNQLAFLALESFIESPKMRSRFHRVNVSDCVMKIGADEVFPVANVGYGGACLEIPRERLLESRNFKKARRINFSLQLGQAAAISGEAEVCWVLKKDLVGARAGVGVRFLDMPADEEAALKAFVRNQKHVTLTTASL